MYRNKIHTSWNFPKISVVRGNQWMGCSRPLVFFYAQITSFTLIKSGSYSLIMNALILCDFLLSLLLTLGLWYILMPRTYNLRILSLKNKQGK